MANAPGPQLSLTPKQCMTLLLIEQAQASLALGITQLTNLGLQGETNVLKKAHAGLEDDKQRLFRDWTRSVVVAPPAAISVIEGLKVNGS